MTIHLGRTDVPLLTAPSITGVWQRIENTVFMLERTTSPVPFDLRNRFTITIQDQPHGARKAECEQIAEAIVVALNSTRDTAHKEEA